MLASQRAPRLSRSGVRTNDRPRALRAPGTRGRGAACRGMYVPSDSLGGVSPEKKASIQLRTLFTFLAVRIICAQMSGSGRGNLGAYNSEGYARLRRLLEEVPFRDGDAWLETLMQEDPALALRVAEVRDAYASEDFEWDQLKRLCLEDTKKSNTALMVAAAKRSLSLSVADSPAAVQAAPRAAEAEAPAAAAAEQPAAPGGSASPSSTSASGDDSGGRSSRSSSNDSSGGGGDKGGGGGPTASGPTASGPTASGPTASGPTTSNSSSGSSSGRGGPSASSSGADASPAGLEGGAGPAQRAKSAGGRQQPDQAPTPQPPPGAPEQQQQQQPPQQEAGGEEQEHK